MLMNSLTAIREHTTHLITQLYIKHIPAPCLLCGINSAQSCLCHDCLSALPLLGHHCQSCARPISLGQYCGQCLVKPPIRDLTHSLFRYTSPIDRLIGDMKYHHQLQLTDYFANELSRHIQQQDRPKPQQLVPIPLHPKRLRQRGYNQSTELARTLSKQLNIPVDNAALTRVKNTLPQTQLAYSKRKKNMKSAFQCQPNTLPEHIALIDDVVTTGHTADMAAKACLQQGVKKVELWTIARTIREHA